MLFSFDTAWQKSGGASAPPAPPVSTPLILCTGKGQFYPFKEKTRGIDPQDSLLSCASAAVSITIIVVLCNIRNILH